MKDSLGDRIKRYENVTRNYLTPKVPVAIRVDGKAFHTITRQMEKPFDRNLIYSMISATEQTAKDMQGFKLAYVQSDEATFVLSDLDDIKTQGWFDYNHQKLVSISAANMSVNFNSAISDCEIKLKKPAVFDSRAFNIPKEEIANMLLWRAKDWNRNSLQMYARAFFSHKELHGKGKYEIHEMLYSIGKNWKTDLSNVEKNGMFIAKIGGFLFQFDDVLPTFDSIYEIVDGSFKV